MGASAAIVGLVIGYGVYQATKVSIPKIPRIDQGFDVKRILNPDYNIPVCYGEVRTEGNIVFYDVTGDKNKFLDIVTVVCEGEIEGFTAVYMDDGALPLFDGFGSTLATGTELPATHPLYAGLTSEGTFKRSFVTLNQSFLFYDGSTTVIVQISTIGSTSYTDIVNYFNASVDPLISKATYSVRTDGNGFDINYDTVGTAGNSFRIDLREPYNTNYPDGEQERLQSVTLSGGRDTVYAAAYFYNGTDAQAANAQLISSYPPDADTTGWTSSHTLSGLAYMYIRLTHNPDLFDGAIPKFSFELKGRKVYDPRTTTTIYSENPAVCLRDYLLNTRFGKGLDSNVIDETSVINAANDCDVLKDGLNVDSSPITYSTYAIGAVVDTSKPIKDNVQYFLQSMNSTLPYFDGSYFVSVLKAGTSVVSFDENNIIGEISISSSSKRDRYNRVIITFPDKDRHFKKGDAPIENPTYLSEDNGQLLEKRVEAPYVNYYPRAKDIAELAMNTSRAGIGAEFTSTMEVLKAIPGDIIDITYPLFGWTNKEFRIEKITSRIDGFCDVAVTEHNDAYYSLSTQQEQQGSSTTNLVDPRDVSKPEIDEVLSDSSTHLINVDGSVTPRIYVTWTNTDAYPYQYEIYLKKSTDTTFTKVGQVYKDDATAFYIPNVEWGENYDVGVAVVNGVGYTSAVSIATVQVTNPFTGASYDYPDVRGLELIGEGTKQGQGNNTEFTGRDIKLQWRQSSSNVTFEFGSRLAEDLGAVGGVLPFTLKGYRIEVFHPGDTIPRQEYFSTQPNFIYPLDKNIEDGNGVPSRVVTFKVYAVGQVADTGISGESEKAATITVTNSAPALPTGFSITVGFQTISLSYNRPTIADWSGMLVWMDTTSSFTPSATNLVYSGNDNKIILSGLVSGQTYYIRYALIDTFVDNSQTDTTGLNVSAENTVTTNVAVTSSEIQSIIADKIAAGTLGEAVTLGGVFVASGTEAVLNGTGPTLGTFRLDMGPVAHTGATYILNYYNGYDDAEGSYISKFSIDESGNATLDGTIYSTAGEIGGWTLSASELASSNMWLNTTSQYMAVNSTTYGNQGIQLQYNSGTPRAHIGDKNGGGSFFEFDGSNVNISGFVFGSSFSTTGSYLTQAAGFGATTLNVKDTSSFSSSGSGYIIGGADPYDSFSWTGKTATTLTGCTGVSANPIYSVVIESSSVVIYEGNQNLNIYGNRGDSTVDILASIGGVNSLGYCATLGSQNSGTSKNGVGGFSDTGDGVVGRSSQGYGIYARRSPSNLAPFRIESSGSSSAPTHSAGLGAIWLNSLGDLYVNTSGSTTWKQIQYV